MSELQLGLLAIGIAVVAGVFGYNKWQEAKLRRKTGAAFAPRAADILLDSRAHQAQEGGEAHLGSAGEAEEYVGTEATQRVEHTLGPAADPAVRSGRSPVLIEGVDYVVEVECAEPVRGEAVRAAIVGHFGDAKHRVSWEGFNPDTNAWERGTDGGRYELLRLGRQLATRSGPVSEADLVGFAASAEAVASSLGGVADFPDVREGLAQAAELDRFCADVDVQIGFNIVRPDGAAFPGTKIRTLAEAAGCTLDGDGRYRRRDETGAELYALGRFEGAPFRSEAMRELSVPGLTVTLDLPRAPDGANAFRRFLDFTRQLAQTLGGTVVDDNRRPLSDAAFEQIAAQLDSVQKVMAARGIRPGSPVALRVFS